LADFSIIEFLVYGGIGYAGVIILMISVLINPPTSVSMAGARSAFLSPSVICMGLLIFASGNVTMGYTDTTTNDIGYNVTNTNQVISNSTITTNTTDKFILVDPVWTYVHMGLFLILIMYIFIQIVTILTKPS
jgi:hypothetical protein